MRMVFFFTMSMLIVGFAQLENPLRNIDNIERHSLHWFNSSSLVRYSKIVRHESYESEKGGVVCYRAIHPAFVDVVCLGWYKNAIENLESYRIKSL